MSKVSLYQPVQQESDRRVSLVVETSEGQRQYAGWTCPEIVPLVREDHIALGRVGGGIQHDGLSSSSLLRGLDHAGGLESKGCCNGERLKAFVLDELRHELWSRAAEVIQGLPGIADQRGVDSGGCRQAYEFKVKFVGIEHLVDDDGLGGRS
ncbi:hypothetical protein [Kibdelosporangium philippinense]|uniref:hypothetical protein n=1 Tax=Kibdelosporangium philippinense TaxID=211113 RepID=UPI0036085BC1